MHVNWAHWFRQISNFFFVFLKCFQRQQTLYRTIHFDQMIKSNWSRRVDDLIKEKSNKNQFSWKLICAMSTKRSKPTKRNAILCVNVINKATWNEKRSNEKDTQPSFNYSLFLCEIHRAELDIMWIWFLPHLFRKHVHRMQIHLFIILCFIISIIKSLLFIYTCNWIEHGEKNTMRKAEWNTTTATRAQFSSCEN